MTTTTTTPSMGDSLYPMGKAAFFDYRNTLDEDENDRRWKQFFTLIEPRNDRYGIPPDVRKRYKLCPSNYMNYAKARHSENPICTMLVMQHRMFSRSCNLSLSKRVLVQIFRDMGDEVGWYPELGSSEREHVLNYVVPPTDMYLLQYSTSLGTPHAALLCLNDLMPHHLDRSTSILPLLRQSFAMLQHQRRIL